MLATSFEFDQQELGHLLNQILESPSETVTASWTNYFIALHDWVEINHPFQLFKVYFRYQVELPQFCLEAFHSKATAAAKFIFLVVYFGVSLVSFLKNLTSFYGVISNVPFSTSKCFWTVQTLQVLDTVWVANLYYLSKLVH